MSIVSQPSFESYTLFPPRLMLAAPPVRKLLAAPPIAGLLTAGTALQTVASPEFEIILPRATTWLEMLIGPIRSREEMNAELVDVFFATLRGEQQ